MFFMTTDGLELKLLTEGGWVVVEENGTRDSEAPETCGFCCTPLGTKYFKTPYGGKYCNDRCALLFTED